MGELSDAIEKHIGVRILEDTFNHYSLLGLKVNATPSEIKHPYELQSQRGLLPIQSLNRYRHNVLRR